MFLRGFFIWLILGGFCLFVLIFACFSIMFQHFKRLSMKGCLIPQFSLSTRFLLWSVSFVVPTVGGSEVHRGLETRQGTGGRDLGLSFSLSLGCGSSRPFNPLSPNTVLGENVNVKKSCKLHKDLDKYGGLSFLIYLLPRMIIITQRECMCQYRVYYKALWQDSFCEGTRVGVGREHVVKLIGVSVLPMSLDHLSPLPSSARRRELLRWPVKLSTSYRFVQTQPSFLPAPAHQTTPAHSAHTQETPLRAWLVKASSIRAPQATPEGGREYQMLLVSVTYCCVTSHPKT